MKKSFFWKIAIPYILLVLAAMAILGWLISSLYTNSVQQTMRDNLLAEAGIVANQAADMISEDRVPELENAIIDQAKVAGARITIIQKDGLVLAESELNPSIMENHLDRPEVRAALEGRESAEIRFSNTVLERLLYAAVPIRSNGEIIGIARLAVPIKSIEQNVQSINRIIWGTTGMIVLSVIAIAIVITGYSMQPLRKLTLLANQISKVDDTEKISVTPKDEIGQMTDAFHRMADGLDRQIQDFKREQTKLSTILTTMTDGILLVNDEGMVELFNPATQHLFNIEEEESVPINLVEIVRDHQLIDMWEKCRLEQKNQIQTLEMTPERITIQCVVAPLGSDLPGYVLILFQDFTQLRKLEVVRRDFVSNVSHELRTPLASLKAIAETLQQGALKDKKASQKFVTMMESEIDNLIQMVEEQLELSRIESGRVPLNLNTCRPCDLITNAQNRMKVQAERAGLELTMQCDDDLPSIHVDGARIEQVLVNLIHNAIKFTPPRGKITVSAKRVEKQVIFMVKDTGIGISEQDLPRIFERFYKTDRARAGGGTGLGLSISRHIIETHHGQIWVDSKPGDGSTFYFSVNI